MLKLPKQVKIVEKFKIFLAVSLAVILAGAIVLIAAGMNVGVDFAGGAKIEIELGSFAAEGNLADPIKDEIKGVITEEGYQINGDIQSSNSSDGLVVTYEVTLRYYHNGDLSESEQSEFITLIQGDDGSLADKLYDGLNDLFENDSALKARNASIEEDDIKAYVVGATASSGLLRSAIIALSVAIVVMLIYIIIRFTLASALASVCALLHDVLIMIALTVIFRIPVNSTFIAAVITIVGYSINATIIIFDRIREERKKMANEALTDVEVANMSIAKTLNRTILTTLTTLIMVVMLAIFSVTTIREFIIPIIFGLIAGTYSSVFLASGFWVMFRKIGQKIKSKREAKKA